MKAAKRIKRVISALSRISLFKKQPGGSLEPRKVPYGISDFQRIRESNYYYVDKTGYLKNLEESGEYLFFIRPRRFGKSLLLSMLETYYDIDKKKDYKTFFKGTEIYKNPTREKHSYLILRFNFSAVDPSSGIEEIKDSFLNNIKTVSRSFLNKYFNRLPGGKRKSLETLDQKKSASDILLDIMQLCRDSKNKIYLLIDEYDNFANTILSSIGTDKYKEFSRGAGFLRAFFNTVKEGATGSGAPISRLFITGVSPITMDDVTSGFNIGENISLDPLFSRMLGFTGPDVEQMLEYYKSHGLINHPADFLMETMRVWYNRYRFSKKIQAPPIYNSDMVLYFLKEYMKEQSMPDDLIDRNVRIDYWKLRHLIITDRGKKKIPNGNFSKLKDIIENGKINSKLVKGFPIEKLANPENFVSLLFYNGLLAVDGVDQDKLRLIIPNETIKRLYYEYIKDGYGETGVLNIDIYKYGEIMSGMAYNGDWRLAIEYITGLMKESMSLRDLITGEKSIQAFLNVYLGLSDLYMIHTEREFNKGYADLMMEPFVAKYEGISYSYLLEIKYIESKNKKIAKKSTAVDRLRKEAEKQLEQYSVDKKFQKSINKTKLVKLVLIFAGAELIYLEEPRGQNNYASYKKT